MFHTANKNEVIRSDSAKSVLNMQFDGPVSLHSLIEEPMHKKTKQVRDTHNKSSKSSSKNNLKTKQQKAEKSADSRPSAQNNQHVCFALESKSNEKYDKENLILSNKQLSKENKHLRKKLLSVNLHFTKKNFILKENLRTLNAEFICEKNNFDAQYQELLNQYDILHKEIDNASKVCHTCKALNKSMENLKDDYVILKRSNTELLEDIDMLKNIIYRLSVQLEKYQEKLYLNKTPCTTEINNANTENTNIRIPSDKFILEENCSEHLYKPKSWGKVNLHTLGPLLNAYQETILEKEEIINNYDIKITKFTEQLKQIIKENKCLHNQVNEEYLSSTFVSDGSDTNFELKTIKEQNDILSKICILKECKVQEILKFSDQKVRQLKLDYELLHSEYTKHRSENTALRKRNKLLDDIQRGSKSEHHILEHLHTNDASD